MAHWVGCVSMIRLNVKRAAVKEELQKGSTGALGSIAKQHASTVLVTECELANSRPNLTPLDRPAKYV